MTHPLNNADLVMRGHAIAQQTGNSDMLDIVNSHTFDRLPLQHKVDFLRMYASRPGSDIPKPSFTDQALPVAEAGLGGAAMGGLVGSMLAVHNPYKNHYLAEMNAEVARRYDEEIAKTVEAGKPHLQRLHPLKAEYMPLNADLLRAGRDQLKYAPLSEEDALWMHREVSPGFRQRWDRFRAKTPEQKARKGMRALQAELPSPPAEILKQHGIGAPMLSKERLSQVADLGVDPVLVKKTLHDRYIPPEIYEKPVRKYISRLRRPTKMFALGMGLASAGTAYMNQRSEEKTRQAANAALHRIRTGPDPDAEAMALMFRKEDLQAQRSQTHHLGINHMDAALKYGPLAFAAIR